MGKMQELSRHDQSTLITSNVMLDWIHAGRHDNWLITSSHDMHTFCFSFFNAASDEVTQDDIFFSLTMCLFLWAFLLLVV